ncbi:MAG: cyclic nucleotide-binding domain-containing protein [Gemmatimonadetes bacterium]|nr:cyclic nucleotide-binding domain-containing protein [Gemmatimonadota bacterium]
MADGAAARRSPFASFRGRGDAGKLLAMMALGFTVIFVVGVLRPIRDAIALDGLEPGDFYQVYFVSAIVVLFAPIYNRLADRVPWRRLIPGVALFFALSMVAFRLVYRPGVPFFGLAFYGWYDLMVAALITQFFMATQVFYNARDAKRAYPLVIAAGSFGAAVGGGITAFFATRLGTPNLLIVAAAAIAAFAFGIAVVWAREEPKKTRSLDRSEEDDAASGLAEIFRHPQVRLIAITVLLTVLVKQFIDYEYKTLTREVFTDLDALSGFLGLVDAATQWLPIVVLLAMRPILRRWGAGAAVLIFPAAMIAATAAMAVALSLAVAVVARTSEKTFRYSAERTGREILYVPVPEDIKLKAKTYIDVGVEKGVGKALSGVLLAIPALTLGSMAVRDRLVIVAVVGVALAGLLLLAFLRARKQYVTSLARSFEGRTASLGGSYISMAESGALGLARDALRTEDPLKVAFTLDMLDEASGEDLAELGPELHALLDHDSAPIRRVALETLSRSPETMDGDRVRARLSDGDAGVREASVGALVASAEDPAGVFERLLSAEEPETRAAALARAHIDLSRTDAERLVRPHFERLRATDTAERSRTEALELAAMAGLVPAHQDVDEIIRSLTAHEDDEIASVSIRSAGKTEHAALVPDLVQALGSARTRAAAREALAGRGVDVVDSLISRLNDPAADAWIRKGAAATLGDIADPATVDALIGSYLLPDTEQMLDDQALVSLHRLRATDAGLAFPEPRVLAAVDREVAAAARYERARVAASELPDSSAQRLLHQALSEAAEDRFGAVFRWLGLVHPQHGMERTRFALRGEDARARANALEWLESTIGHAAFRRLAPLVEGPRTDGDERVAMATVRELWDDEDAWIARCALWAMFEAEQDRLMERLTGFEPRDPGLRRTASRIAGRSAAAESKQHEEDEMDLIEKVFLLQNVDLLSGVRSRQLALFASIAREQRVKGEHVFFRKGEPTLAMHVVIEGAVRMEGLGEGAVTLGPGEAFGTWALIDEQPSLVEARAAEDSRVLRVLQVDFHDLLVDHPELGLDLLQGLARRVRALATA